ncbi:hypothetical protein ACTXT7_003401 [Hymenolepis weldensis]
MLNFGLKTIGDHFALDAGFTCSLTHLDHDTLHVIQFSGIPIPFTFRKAFCKTYLGQKNSIMEPSW